MYSLQNNEEKKTYFVIDSGNLAILGQVFFFLLTRFLERRLSLSKNEQLKLTKYCWAFTLKHRNDNTKCYSKQ